MTERVLAIATMQNQKDNTCGAIMNEGKQNAVLRHIIVDDILQKTLREF